MIDPQRAFELVREHVTTLAEESVSIDDAHRRVLARDARSRTDLPPFRQSAVDGYAVRASELAAAGVALPVSDALAAAPRDAVPSLRAGTCARVFTGAPVPDGADAVLMQEQVQRDGDVATFETAATLGQNIRLQGEEVRDGDVLLATGTRLDAARAAALATAGIDQVAVFRRPRVVAWVGGDEIVPAGTLLRPGQVFDANGPMLRGWFAERGLDVDVRRLPDDRAATREALRASFAEADLVVTTGGVSVGDHDHVVPAAEQEGAERVFWKVAQKPGKPLYVARRGDATLIGLPGNPGAVFVGLSLYVTLALDCLEGVAAPGAQWATGTLTTPIAVRGRHRFLRVQADASDAGVALSPLPRQASHMISNLAECDAIAWIPPSDVPMTSVRWTSTRGR